MKSKAYFPRWVFIIGSIIISILNFHIFLIINIDIIIINRLVVVFGNCGKYAISDCHFICKSVCLSACLSVCLFGTRYRSQLLTNRHQIWSTYQVTCKTEPYIFSKILIETFIRLMKYAKKRAICSLSGSQLPCNFTNHIMQHNIQRSHLNMTAA